MDTAILVAITGGIVALIGTVINSIIIIMGRRSDRQSRRDDMEPPSWTEVYTRLDALDKKLNAAIRIIVSQNDQWPSDYDPPRLDTTDVKIIEDTLPARFRSLPRTRSAR